MVFLHLLLQLLKLKILKHSIFCASPVPPQLKNSGKMEVGEICNFEKQVHLPPTYLLFILYYRYYLYNILYINVLTLKNLVGGST